MVREALVEDNGGGGEARQRLRELLKEAAEGAIGIVKDGKPVGVPSVWPELDAESLGYATSPELWQLIRQRRQESTIPWAEAKKLAGL